MPQYSVALCSSLLVSAAAASATSVAGVGVEGAAADSCEEREPICEHAPSISPAATTASAPAALRRPAAARRVGDAVMVDTSPEKLPA
ncbi:MAG: hypothetical protein ACAH24_10460 [Hyphomicrobiaceae bacterium]